MKRPLLFALFGLAGIVAAVVLALFWGVGDEPMPQIPGLADSPQFLKPPTPLEPSQAKPAGQSSDAGSSEGQDKPPVFDVVRINPKGDTLIAGQAAPGAEVTILDGAKEIGKVMADSRGEWVFIPTGPLSPGAKKLKLRAKTVGGVVLESQAQAEMVVPSRDGADGKAGAAPERGNLALDLIEDEKPGQLALSGRGTPKSALQIFFDNRLLGKVETDAKGAWALKSPVKIDDNKMHVFRADELGAEGRVSARIELPYTREELMEDFARPNVMVVKPGQSIEKIAIEFYGDRAAAKAIYEVNKNQMAGPGQLIPGQLLFLPSWP